MKRSTNKERLPNAIIILSLLQCLMCSPELFVKFSVVSRVRVHRKKPNTLQFLLPNVSVVLSRMCVNQSLSGNVQHKQV